MELVVEGARGVCSRAVETDDVEEKEPDDTELPEKETFRMCRSLGFDLRRLPKPSQNFIVNVCV